MTDYSRPARTRRAATVEDEQAARPRRPWPVTLRNLIAALIAAVPVLIEIAHALNGTYGDTLPWLAQFVVVLTIVTRVLNSHAFETWAAHWAPWLSSHDLTPPDDSGDYTPRHARGVDDL